MLERVILQQKIYHTYKKRLFNVDAVCQPCHSAHTNATESLDTKMPFSF